MSNLIVHTKILRSNPSENLWYISRYITRNNIPKCFLESDFLASCSGTPFKLLYFPKIVGK